MAGPQMGGVPISAPGAASTRTDIQPARVLGNAAYGEGKDFAEIQAGAPMQQMARPRPMPTGLFAPSQRPNEPITAGVDYGDGPDSTSLMTTAGPNYRPAVTLTGTLAKLSAAMPGDTRLLGLLEIAQRRGW